jgi:hypothetical protein
VSQIVVGVAPVGQHMRRASRDRIACSIIGCRVEVLIGLRVRRLWRTFYSAAVLMGWNTQSRKRGNSTVTYLWFHKSGPQMLGADGARRNDRIFTDTASGESQRSPLSMPTKKSCTPFLLEGPASVLRSQPDV